MLLLLLTAMLGYAAEPPKPSCYIPLQVKTYDVDPGFYQAYTQGVYGAIEEWNSKRMGFYFHIVNWNSAADANDHQVTISVGPLDHSKVGMTWSRTGQHSMIDRIKIVVSNSQAFCRRSGQKDCYGVKSTVLHELGHAVGLRHAESDTSMMWFGIKYRSEAHDTVPDIDVQTSRRLWRVKGCTGSQDTLEWGTPL